MIIVLIFFTIQGLLGIFDTLYHHEFKERLPWKASANKELLIHSIRNFFYFVIFLSLGWTNWNGLFAWLFGLILMTEILLTLWDFVVEDKTRKLPASERITHTILALNYGAILAFFIPELMIWAKSSTGFSVANYGIWSWVMTLYAISVLLWAFRDYFSSCKTKSTVLPGISLNQPNMKFLVTGGSGFIGSRLCQMLINAGHHVTILTRDKAITASKFNGKITLIDSIDNAGDNYDIIINLAGESLSNERWTKKKKQELYDSRLKTTQLIIDYIKVTANKPALLINGSAIGFYGNSESVEFTEESTPADHDFTHDLCHQWEQMAYQARDYGVRVCCLRIGIVLGTTGGALAQMLFPFEFGLGGKMGNGKQWMSWIHIDDLIGIIAHVINNIEIDGPINSTAPEPVTNQEFTKALGKALRRPTLLTIPAFNLRLLFGEMANLLLLQGQKVLPTKALETNYQFQYKMIKEALNQLLRK